MDATTLKALCIPLVLVLNLVAGGLPYCLIYRRSRAGASSLANSPRLTRCLSLASCFSAGVFLATCFVGLFPSVDAKYRSLMARLGRTVSYPVPEVTVCGGFFAVWFLEQLLHQCVHKCSSGGQSTTSTTEASVNGSMAIGGRDGPQSGRMRLLDHEEQAALQDDAFEEEEEENGHFHATENHDTGHGHSHLPMGGENESALRAILLTFALGSHSILEGLGFGLMEAVNQVINMAIAIVLHECLCALSLGLQLANQKTRPCLASVLLITFSALIPLGVGFGLSLEAGATSLTGHIVTLVLQGMAAGTFIYVVFFEILPPEIASRRDRLSKVFATALGFLTIALLRLMISDKA